MGQAVKIGYARVSTDDQSLSLQLDALQGAGCERVFEDKISGAKAERPGLAAALSQLRGGDTLIVWRLDRLGRSVADLLHLVGEIQAAGAGFESLTEKIDTTGAAGRLVFHVFAAFAEFERNLIRERTNAGLVAAKARGRQGGRPGLDPGKIAAIKALAADKNNTPTAICKTLGISRATFYRYSAGS